MKIVNLAPQFNLVNNGFCYLCIADDGTFWIRSTAGNWAQIKLSTPMDDVDIIDADFQLFLKSGIIVTENDIKIENSSQVIVDPIKIETNIVVDTPIT